MSTQRKRAQNLGCGGQRRHSAQSTSASDCPLQLATIDRWRNRGDDYRPRRRRDRQRDRFRRDAQTCIGTSRYDFKNRVGRRLDSQTAFEIVSIDIADIDVGENIGARLQADRAEADTRVARARAEGRRAMAVAKDQENLAKIEESRSKLVEAEAEVPKAMAEGFQSGRLGIMDYYKMRNIQADTEMRKAIANVGAPSSATIASPAG